LFSWVARYIMFWIVIALGVSLSIAGFIFLRNSFGDKSKLWITKDEDQYVDPLTSLRKNFSSLLSPPSVTLSCIIPSYNEEERLPIMLDETLEYLENRAKQETGFTYELVVVDDGSRDRTSEVALRYSKQYSVDKIRVLTLQKNRGKGGAVKRGMMVSRGKYLLMVDADGATRFSDLARVEKGLKDIEKKDLGVVVGSRAHLEQQAVAKRSPFRNVLMYGFHILVSILGVRGVKDTQCGFKLFTRQTARLLFTNLHIERWAFDVELLYVAQSLQIPIAEVAVNWTEIPGSKLTPLAASVQMAKDLFRIRCGYMFFWKINPNPSERDYN